MKTLALRGAFTFVAVLPFVGLVACDLVKKDAAQAVDASAAATAAQTTTGPTLATAAPPPVEPVAPLGAAANAGGTPAHAGTAATTTHPKADGGVAVADAGASDAGHATTPPFTLPSSLPSALAHFDAGTIKLPAGFPSTIPTFAPPPQ